MPSKRKPTIVRSEMDKRLEKKLSSKSKDKCAKWKELGYSSLAGCRHDNPKKPISKKDRMKMMEAKKG